MATKQHNCLKLAPEDLPIAMRIAGYHSFGALSKGIGAGGGAIVKARSLSGWAANESTPNLDSWRMVEDHLAARGVTPRAVAAEKAANEKN